MRIPLSYNLRNLRERKTTTALTAAGIAVTVAVLVSVMALSEGVRGSLEASGHPLNLIVMRKGATAELTSVLSWEAFQVIRAHPGVEAASLEVITGVSLAGFEKLDLSNLTLRGLTPEGLRMREGIRISAGRMFTPGKREILLGRGIPAKYSEARLGRTLQFGRGGWLVVGIIEAESGSCNSEIFADLNQVAADFGRPQALSSALIRVRDEAALHAVRANLQQDRRLTVQAIPEKDYYRSQMVSAAPIQFMGSVVSILLAVGSCFSAMNTMYAAVARRAPEIATLRVLGFSRASILSSFLAESLLLSIIGGTLGCLLALPLDNLDTAIGNFVTFTEFAFRLRITWSVALTGMAASAILGVLGGLLPAWAASRRDVLSALRGA